MINGYDFAFLPNICCILLLFYFIIEDLSSLYSKDMNNSLMLKPQSRFLSLNPSHYTEKNSRAEDAYTRRLFFAPSVFENASRTPGALF